mmetsp:Transcript_5541/g.19838  ORF Transcript_5541/g.19838 Transcript_5541/m.19838 type:complete len:219 (+) Transcript_5541:1103-1759(+)
MAFISTCSAWWAALTLARRSSDILFSSSHVSSSGPAGTATPSAVSCASFGMPAPDSTAYPPKRPLAWHLATATLTYSPAENSASTPFSASMPFTPSRHVVSALAEQRTTRSRSVGWRVHAARPNTAGGTTGARRAKASMPPASTNAVNAALSTISAFASMCARLHTCFTDPAAAFSTAAGMSARASAMASAIMRSRAASAAEGAPCEWPWPPWPPAPP